MSSVVAGALPPSFMRSLRACCRLRFGERTLPACSFWHPCRKNSHVGWKPPDARWKRALPGRPPIASSLSLYDRFPGRHWFRLQPPQERGFVMRNTLSNGLVLLLAFASTGVAQQLLTDRDAFLANVEP